MKSYTVYVCETCGKESKDWSDIRRCEADHLGLNLLEMDEYERLQTEAEHFGYVVGNFKCEETEKAFDLAIKRLVAFEKEHNII